MTTIPSLPQLVFKEARQRTTGASVAAAAAAVTMVLGLHVDSGLACQ